jgi:hypothetical protein
MANQDRPNGFRPVKSLDGKPWVGSVRSIVPGADDLFIGDLISNSSNAAVQSATNDATILGVVVGFGKVDGEGNEFQYDPTNLSKNWFDTSADVEADWVVFYAPASETIFEAQTSTALTLAVGDTCDLLATDGDQTTGRSAMELNTNTNADFVVVDVPNIVGNDPALIHGRYLVKVTAGEVNAVLG